MTKVPTGQSHPSRYFRTLLPVAESASQAHSSSVNLSTRRNVRRNSQAAISAMQQAQPQVTSVVCWCDVSNVRDGLMRVASAQVYQPEWVLSNYLDNYVDNSFRQAPPDQSNNVIGVSLDKWLPNQETPWWAAMKEGNPGYTPGGENQGFPMSGRYNSLLVLTSGIQAAEPKLTPGTFEQGLFKAKWPNANAGGPPYYQARSGFDGGRHTLIADGTMYWYDRSQQSTVEPTSSEGGAICYVRHGARYGLGQWPEEDPQFYQGPCR